MEKQASDPKQWQVGTSTTLFTEFSKAELQECASAGITHIELVVPGLLLESDEGYRQLSARVDLIKEAGLQLWSVHLPFGKQWDTSSPDESFRTNIINIFAKAIAFFAGLGASRAVIHPGYEHTPDPDRAARLKRTKEALHYLAHVGVDHGLTLAVECLPRTCLGNTSAEIQELLAGSDQL
jgi:sugar phosphate isomerase/epimerase